MALLAICLQYEGIQCQFVVFQDCANYRIYDREVVELSKDVSLLILVPSPEDVCSCPGEGDIFSANDRFLSIPVPVFEMSKYTLLHT